MQPPESRSPSAPWVTRSHVAASLAAAFANVLFHGYAFGLQNQHIQLPYLWELQHPELYPGDPLVEAMGSYFSYFWLAMAWLTERLPAEPTFFALHLCAVFLRYLGIAALARGVWPALPRATWIAMWLAFFGHSGIGYEPLNWNYLAHTTLGTALGLWALAAAVRGRVLLAALLGGLLFNLHAMQSAYVALMLAGALGLGRGLALGRLAAGLALFVLAALPGLAWLASSGGLAAPADFPELVRTFFPFHFYPSSFAWPQWVSLGVYVGATWAGVHVAERARAQTGAEAPGRAARMAVALLGFWLVGGAWSELWPAPFVLKLHVFRSSAYMFFALSALWSGPLSRGLDWAVARAQSPALGAAAFALAAVPTSLHLVPSASAGALALVALAAALAWLLAVLLSSARARRACAGLALVGGLASAGYVGFARGREAHLLAGSLEPWHAVQRWAAEHSEPSDVFLTPPYISGFRVFSRRPIVGEVQDSSAILWSSQYADYWRTWLERLSGPLDGEAIPLWEKLAREWFAKDQAQIEALGREYGARYVVLRRPREREARLGWEIHWDGAPLYDNGVFSVYALPR